MPTPGQLRCAARSGRRRGGGTALDGGLAGRFSAGLESADKVADAIKNYVLAQTEYLRTVNDYNMNVAQLARLTGELR
jgi:hypothetical protein